jgi:1-deoxy-D-xylulose-5-phosphate reductoisomerase
MKRIAILGSTGSIGRNVLNVARHLKDHIQVVALAARENVDLLEEQAKEFQPDLIAVYEIEKAESLKKRLPNQQIMGGLEGLQAVATHTDANFVVSAIAGTMGLEPTLAAIQAGKDIGLANKEALVSGGNLVIKWIKEKNVQLIPIDSEHSAIFQCLNGESKQDLKRIILTASGGPFLEFTNEQLEQVTPEQALRHPNWSMGPKVTIDSSTLMNKGLEVIEAYWLFNLPIDKIDVIIHPQSVIHSLIELIDHSMLVQMGEPNMITPIQYALTYPHRYPSMLKPFDFFKNPVLQFLIPDLNKFRCLALAYEAIRQGGSLPCYMNAANEVLVQRFLRREISWKEIAIQLEHLMLQHVVEPVDSVETILEIDKKARQDASHSNTSLIIRF